jgi:hypothetical protein
MGMQWYLNAMRLKWDLNDNWMNIMKKSMETNAAATGSMLSLQSSKHKTSMGTALQVSAGLCPDPCGPCIRNQGNEMRPITVYLH